MISKICPKLQVFSSHFSEVISEHCTKNLLRVFQLQSMSNETKCIDKRLAVKNSKSGVSCLALIFNLTPLLEQSNNNNPTLHPNNRFKPSRLLEMKSHIPFFWVTLVDQCQLCRQVRWAGRLLPILVSGGGHNCHHLSAAHGPCCVALS